MAGTAMEFYACCISRLDNARSTADTDRSVVFGDIRRPEDQEDGTTSVPMPVQHSEHSATIRNLVANCFTHAVNHTITIRSPKNQANGNLSIYVTGSGQVEDVTGSDILVAGDDMALVLEADSSGINEFGVLAVELETGGGSVEDVETVSP